MSEWTPVTETEERLPTCPKCGYVDAEGGAYLEDEEETDYDCDRCGAHLTVRASISILYYTSESEDPTHD